MNKNLFAYGTLMFPAIAQRVAGLDQIPAEAALHGFARYAVKNREKAQVPAIISEQGGEVVGKLYRDISRNAWALLDHFEEIDKGLYVRESVVVLLTDGASIEADTYVAGATVRNLLRGEWDAVEFQTRHLSYYMEALLPGFLAEPRRRARSN